MLLGLACFFDLNKVYLPTYLPFLTKPSLAVALSSSWYILSVLPGLVLIVMYAVGLFVVSSAVVRKKIGCAMEYV